MTTEEIINGNKLIAEFMGLAYCEKYLYEGWYGNSEFNYRICSKDGLRYHKSWNDLMPVIEKIQNIENFIYPYGIYKYLVSIQINFSNKCFSILPAYDIPPSIDEPNIEKIEFYENNLITNCWLGVVKFIEWYNENYEKNNYN